MLSLKVVLWPLQLCTLIGYKPMTYDLETVMDSSRVFSLLSLSLKNTKRCKALFLDLWTPVQHWPVIIYGFYYLNNNQMNENFKNFNIMMIPQFLSKKVKIWQVYNVYT